MGKKMNREEVAAFLLIALVKTFEGKTTAEIAKMTGKSTVATKKLLAAYFTENVKKLKGIRKHVQTNSGE